MMMIVGLGNPGRKYQNTRHNLGFLAVNEFAKKNNFPDFVFSKKFNTEITEGFLDGKKIILAKPQTFMNNSGKAVKSLLLFYKLELENLWIVHDDIDLPLGKIRLSKGRGSAGHKGVESIIKELGAKDFWRLRIGIQPKEGKPKNVEKFVLQRLTKEEEKTIKRVVKKTITAINK
jgi:PTH1 family peptidyl-tRNA hydrolase